MVCTFFGHRYTPASVEPRLEACVDELISGGTADRFYLGNHGEFDAMALRVLRRAKKRHPHINYTVILAYPPTYRSLEQLLPEEIFLPEGMENADPMTAIIQRNRWMTDRSDMVVCYIDHPEGGAAIAVNYAKKLKKDIYNLAMA